MGTVLVLEYYNYQMFICYEIIYVVVNGTVNFA